MVKEERVCQLLDLTVPGLIERCRNHFDPDLATRVCMDRSFPQAQRVVIIDNMASFLAMFRNESSRQEFLAFYVFELYEKISGKADCGCVHHAEDGVPCEHDWQMVVMNNPDTASEAGE